MTFRWQSILLIATVSTTEVSIVTHHSSFHLTNKLTDACFPFPHPAFLSGFSLAFTSGMNSINAMGTSLYVIQITLFIYLGITKDLHHKKRVITVTLESRMDGHIPIHSILATRASYWLPSYVLSYPHCLQYSSQHLPLQLLPSNRIFPFNSIRTTTITITTIVPSPYLSSINLLLRSMWWGIINGFPNQINLLQPETTTVRYLRKVKVHPRGGKNLKDTYQHLTPVAVSIQSLPDIQLLFSRNKQRRKSTSPWRYVIEQIVVNTY